MNKEIKITLKNVETDNLNTEQDYRDEMRRQLPETLKQIGSQLAGIAWKGIDEAFRGTPVKAPDKLSFVREKTAEYVRNMNASASERKPIEDMIIEQLKDLKSKQG